MRLAFLVAVVLLLSSAEAVLASLPHAHGDPCDGYGDCVSSSISYLRSNPDDSLYLGDEFVVSLQTTPGRGGAACGNGCSESWSGSLSGVSWSYDESALNANTSDASSSFMVVANSTSGYAVNAAVTFVVSITVCTTGSNGMTTCSHASAVSTITVSEEVQVRALVLAVQTHVVNVTDRATGFVLRN
ncbi:MAG TPA: hypothetical protein VLY65_00265, partial [Nitrososphaerales archaeon]|nr:hypothetical protein [Nitrososphaerales archaeon]